MPFFPRDLVVLVLLQLVSFSAQGWCGSALRSVVEENQSVEFGKSQSGDTRLTENPVQHYSVDDCTKSDAPTVEEEPVGNLGGRVPEEESPVEPYVSQRVYALRDAIDNPFSFASHRANYLVPAAYRELPPGSGLADESRYGLQSVKPLEVQFQVSLQLPIWSGFLGEDSFLSFAYTNTSFWQAYTSSSPFREINHEPELLATWMHDRQWLGFYNVATQVGISHQSNGRGRDDSRGWNRLYANFIFERENYFFAFKPWYRLSQERNVGRGPDLDFHMGNFELTAGYRTGGYRTSIMLRNNLRSENRGAVELSWGFPITNRVGGFIKYFDGYGESLIDYSTRVQALVFGLELAPDF